MPPQRPAKTFADYLVIAVSPALIMVLVGSLVFFLIEVFCRSEMKEGLSWVMFWFVLAIVLVARIGIEQGRGYAMMYGLALAGASWFYLAMLYPAYLLGIVLLSIVWWSANQLTWDCTLIDDDEDASGQGLVEVATQKERPPPPESDHPQKSPTLYSRAARDKLKKQIPQGQPHTPGLWVVYFSLAALPLFGLGHVLIPSENTAERQLGFAYLAAYLAAALGLLLTTSFLGLRRYLRQRLLTMPPPIALGWIKSGAGIAVVVMALSLLVPRPGAEYTWKTLALQMDHYVRTASQYATPPNPPGQGQNGNQAQKSSSEGISDSSNVSVDQNNQSTLEDNSKNTAQAQNAQGTPKSRTPTPPPSNSGEIYFQLKRLLLLAAALWLGWWLFRDRHLILQALQAFWHALLKFIRDLLDLRPRPRQFKKTEIQAKQIFKSKLFTAFKNPFIAGSEKVWPPEQVVAYSFDAVQAWARQQGWELNEQHTPREICAALEARFPEHSSGLQNLAILYGYAAYGQQMPTPIDWEPLRLLWRGMIEANARLY